MIEKYTDMEQVKVSVCIPAYRGEKYIREAIKSVLDQSFQDFEIIIADDQSPDDTVGAIKEFNDPRIKFFQNEKNLGLIANWNKTLSLATGKYIKILPDDDLLYRDCLKIQVDILEADVNKEIAMVCGRKNVINNKGTVLFSRGFSSKRELVSGFEAINRTIRSGSNIIGEGGAVLFRREIINKIGYIDSDIFYVLDLDYWFKILLHGKLCSVPEIVSAFRVSDISQSTIIKDKQQKDCLDFIDKIYNDKKFKLNYSSMVLGKLNTYILSFAKKIIYKFFIKR